MTHIECVLIAHWRTLQHIETHYSPGHFYVVAQQSKQCVSMCFNVQKNTLSNTQRQSEIDIDIEDLEATYSQCARNTLKKH